jgi:hypothetical protein
MGFKFNPFTGNLDLVGAAAGGGISALNLKGTVSEFGGLAEIVAPDEGDVYQTEDTGIFYVWDGATWASIGTLQGAQGQQGPAGAAGVNGADGTDGIDGADGLSVLSGAGAPDAGLGVDGEFYIDTVATAIYGPKTAGAWGSPTSLIGPAGADGVGVPTGGATGQVLAKASATDYDTEWVDQSGGGSGTDLAYDAATRVLSSSTGTDATLPLAAPAAAGLQPATGYGAITYASTIDLDGAVRNGQMNTISLTGTLEFTTSSLANGQEIRLRLIADGTTRALTFPADWKFLSEKPDNITASKEAILSLAVFGTTNADVRAVYLEQP